MKSFVSLILVFIVALFAYPQGLNVPSPINDINLSEAGMSVRIVPVINAVSPIEQGIAEGSSSVTVGTASLPAGQYVLCLLHEGNVVQSVNIIKAAQ